MMVSLSGCISDNKYKINNNDVDNTPKEWHRIEFISEDYCGKTESFYVVGDKLKIEWKYYMDIPNEYTTFTYTLYKSPKDAVNWRTFSPQVYDTIGEGTQTTSTIGEGYYYFDVSCRNLLYWSIWVYEWK